MIYGTVKGRERDSKPLWRDENDLRQSQVHGKLHRQGSH